MTRGEGSTEQVGGPRLISGLGHSDPRSPCKLLSKSRYPSPLKAGSKAGRHLSTCELTIQRLKKLGRPAALHATANAGRWGEKLHACDGPRRSRGRANVSALSEDDFSAQSQYHRRLWAREPTILCSTTYDLVKKLFCDDQVGFYIVATIFTNNKTNVRTNERTDEIDFRRRDSCAHAPTIAWPVRVGTDDASGRR
jgi:hypothetical protein